MRKILQLVLCTCPDLPCAERITHSLLEARLAACINILPQITSVYRWENKIETAQEYLLIIKTSQEVYSTLEKEIKNLHPYKIPEIISMPIQQGLPDYLTWWEQCLEKS